MNKEAQTWIRRVLDRQGEQNLRKRSQIQNDDAIYCNPENEGDEQDLEIDQEDAVVIMEDYHEKQTKECEEPEKPKKAKRSGGKKKTAGKGNLIIDLFLSIRNNNAITLILKNEMIFNTKTINIHKVLTITFL